MKKLLTILLLSPMLLKAQLGAKMDRIINFVGADQIVKTQFSSGYIIQDFKTGSKEVTTFYYRLDSVAVVMSQSRKDSFFNAREVDLFTKTNLKDFKADIKCMQGTTTYHWDTVHQVLLLINYDVHPTAPRITGFAATTDAGIIRAWTSELSGWIRE